MLIGLEGPLYSVLAVRVKMIYYCTAVEQPQTVDAGKTGLQLLKEDKFLKRNRPILQITSQVN